MKNFLLKIFKKRKRYIKSFKYMAILNHEFKVEYINASGQVENYVWGYEDGWLKICFFGGLAYKLKCEDYSVALFIKEIGLLQGIWEVNDYCIKHGWVEWNYYIENYGIKEGYYLA